MGIISDLIKDFQNRPRIFDFRSQTTALQGPTGYEPITAKTTNEVQKSAPVIARELGQYPISRPEYENISNPYEWHQAVVTQKMANAKAYNDQKTVSSPYNIQSEFSMEPPKLNTGSAELPSNAYNKNVLFR